jgi:hypothetical protein
LKRVAILAIALALVPGTVASQTRKRGSRKPRTTTTVPTSSPIVHNGATRVADQIKNLTRFLFVLGGVAKGIEQADASIRRNEASPAIVEQIKKNKATIKQSLADVRAGLDKLEIDFRASPELNRYYTELAGVASGAATAENQAAAGQLEQAGRTLLGVVNRLTDVLLEMP